MSGGQYLLPQPKVAELTDEENLAPWMAQDAKDKMRR